MDYRALISIKNLTLAWERILTGRNLPYKNYFRQIYYVYAFADRENLRDLHQRLITETYEPSVPKRIYMPKASGLQRPITLLYLEDQIVLQALANRFIDRLSRRRLKLQRRAVFSNIVQPSAGKFALTDWKEGYNAFRSEVQSCFDAGFQWVAHFDLTAFYDTISHDLLLKVLYPRKSNRSFSTVLQWLKVWSSPSKTTTTGHGIPQGPLASDILADFFMTPVDERLIKTCRYLRYVDDIRIFGRTEADVRKASVELEIRCRERGLIPHGDKYSIRRIKNVSDAFGSLPSFRMDSDGSGIKVVESERKLTSEFVRSLNKGQTQIEDKTRARFVLYRAEPSVQLRQLVLSLMPKHPEHIDAFVTYLLRFSKSSVILRKCEAYLATCPYDYVRGELWRVLVHHSDFNRELIEKAMEVAKKGSYGFAEKLGALLFLLEAQQNGRGAYSRFLSYQNDLLQAMLAHLLPRQSFASGQAALEIAKREKFEPLIALSQRIVEFDVPLDRIFQRKRLENLPIPAVNVFRSLGLMAGTAPSADPVGRIIARRFGIPKKSWKKMLQSAYGQAFALAVEAEAVFDIGRSQWLMFQNSLNDLILRDFVTHIQRAGMHSEISLVDKNNKSLTFGLIVQEGGLLDRVLPEIASGFRRANDRRNTLPDAHPLERKTGKPTVPLSKAQQTDLVQGLKKTFDEIVRVARL